MGWTDIVVLAVIVAIVGLAAFYVYKAKKSGKKCIGCPDGCSCDTKGTETSQSHSNCCGSCCGCSGCSSEQDRSTN